jgi:hypothetical protein
MLVERRLKQLERWCVFLGVCVLVLGVLFVWSTGFHRWENIRTQGLKLVLFRSNAVKTKHKSTTLRETIFSPLAV